MQKCASKREISKVGKEGSVFTVNEGRKRFNIEHHKSIISTITLQVLSSLIHQWWINSGSMVKIVMLKKESKLVF